MHAQLSKQSTIAQGIVHTGQHFSYAMNDLFFNELRIPEPDINFNIQDASANLFVARAADAMQQYFLAQKDTGILVYGDTNTTLAAAIAASRTGTPLYHFEAGVRTGNLSMPEEINRVLTDRMANVNFCCTAKNAEQLYAEGYGSVIASTVVHTGDLMLDAFTQIAPKAVSFALPQQFVLCTIHRAANLQQQETLQQIVDALNRLHVHIPVMMPVHPHTQQKMEAYGLKPQFVCLPPIGYPQMKYLMQHCSYVITDSGGASREAFFSQKPSLIIMDSPFWPEIIEAGCALQSIANASAIIHQFEQLPQLSSDFNLPIFGDGNAAGKIAEMLGRLVER